MSARTLKAGLIYFALTFGAGFVLGPIRILLLVPRLGVRAAELVEMPVMIVVIWLSARWVTRRFAIPRSVGPRLGVGLLAVALLLTAEFSLVLRLRGLTIEEYLATRDPVTGAAYYGALALMALMPLLVERK
jgi:hypothetical protein